MFITYIFLIFFYTSCIEGYYLELDQTCSRQCNPNETVKNNSCICATGFTLDFINDKKVCSQCTQNCELCEGVQTCLTCVSGFYLQNNQCLQCTTPNCQICNKNSQCSLCNLGYYLNANNFSCVSNCESYQYLNNSVCFNRGYGCSLCSSQFNCNLCLNGFTQEMDGTCNLQCPAFCDSCLSNQICTSCSSNKVLSQGSCVDSCFSNEFLNGQICYSCLDNCENCLDNSSCISCTSGYQLDTNGNCVLKNQQQPGDIQDSFLCSNTLFCEIDRQKYYYNYFFDSNIIFYENRKNNT